MVGLALAAILTVALGHARPAGQHQLVPPGRSNGATSHTCHMAGPPRDAAGQEVEDQSAFVRRTLAGDGSLTARLTAFGGKYAPDGGGPPTPPTRRPAWSTVCNRGRRPGS